MDRGVVIREVAIERYPAGVFVVLAFVAGVVTTAEERLLHLEPFGG
jgi:hypothetical protein